VSVAAIPFEETLQRHARWPLLRAGVRTAQVNVGKLCNQACHHCHVDAGPKRTENRGRSLASYARKLVGQRIAIHASKKRDEEAFLDMRSAVRFPDVDSWFGMQPHELPHATIGAFPLGAIIGVATLERVFAYGDLLSEDEARFYVGGPDGETFGLSFGARQWIEPIANVKGALGFWQLSGEHERELEARIARRTA
jgi:hypothetical protein